jgi:hypothetical protein
MQEQQQQNLEEQAKPYVKKLNSSQVPAVVERTLAW